MGIQATRTYIYRHKETHIDNVDMHKTRYKFLKYIEYTGLSEVSKMDMAS